MIKVRKIIVVVLAILILAVPVCAAENASEIIIDFNAGITKESDGTLVVDFNISTLGSSTRLGASKVIVEVVLQLNDLSDFPMSDDAMTVVLSNLMDNPITTCKAISKIDNRNIIVKMKRSADFWFLYMENTTAEPVKIIDGLVIAKRKIAGLHGYGLENVRTLLDRYDATYAFDYLPARSAFAVSIQFPTETS